MKRFNPKTFAKMIAKDHPEAIGKEVLVSVHDNDGALVIAVLNTDEDYLAMHDTELPGNADPTTANQLADDLAAFLITEGMHPRRDETFGLTWIEDDEEDVEWITISALDYSGNLTGHAGEEMATLMLRDATKNAGLKPQRESTAKFIVDAMNAYVKTPKGQAAWRNHVEQHGK